MTRRAAFTAGVILLCVALQFSVTHWASIAGIEPDLLLAVTVIIGLLSGPRAGMATGFTAGVLEGAIVGRWMGVYAGAKTILGFLSGIVGARLFVENLLVIMGATAVMTLVHEGILGLFGSGGMGFWKTVSLGLGQAAYNAAIALVLGAGLRAVRHWLPPEEPRA